MKNFIKIIVFCLAILWMYSISYAQQGSRTDNGSSPLQVFENVVGNANNDPDKIQHTALDGVSDLEGNNPRAYKISNTLDYFRIHIGPYIQRAVYIGLIASTLGLIICGFLMVTGGISKSSGFEKVKGRIVNALLGVFMLSGFYLVIKLMMSVINYFVE